MEPGFKAKQKGGKVIEVFCLRGTDKAERIKRDVMSACPRDSSSTVLSSRLSGRCRLCRPFSCPPPHTLKGRDLRTKKKVREDMTKSKRNQECN